jgi:hypothetical protein
MPVSRATYEALKTAHAALKVKYRQDVREQADHRAADEATATTITRLTNENAALRRLLAAHIRGLEREGWFKTGGDLRDQLVGAGLDLTAELASGWKPGEGALPAARTFTPSEARLRADLRRRNEACGALEEQRLELIAVNDALNKELREYRDAEQESAA